MNMTQSVQPLSPEDIAILKTRIEKPNLRLLIFLVLFNGLAYVFSLFMGSWVPLIGTILFFLIALAWYLWQTYKTRQFISGGNKTIYSGVIQKRIQKDVRMEQTRNFQASSNTLYCFLVEGREFLVPNADFEKFKEGDSIQIHAVIPNDLVFKVSSA